jgi:dipeptidyl aminopeptidase/acylaminoacyl peptidase
MISFASGYDGSPRQAVVVAAPDTDEKPLPLVIVPHAAGFSAEATARYWRDIPVRRGFIAVFPFGHGRKLDLYSLAWRGQIADLASMPKVLAEQGYAVDESRVYAVGLSMGGLESLMLAGCYPGLLAGVVAFNSPIDLASWYRDIDIGRSATVDEIGGTPDEVPDKYAERSPLNCIATIARIPTLLYWDPNDKVVPSQSDMQTGRLFRRIKEEFPESPVFEKIHGHGHYWVNPGLALRWLDSL